MLREVITVFVSIMIVVGALSRCALLHPALDLKAAWMNANCS